MSTEDETAEEVDRWRSRALGAEASSNALQHHYKRLREAMGIPDAAPGERSFEARCEQNARVIAEDARFARQHCQVTLAVLAVAETLGLPHVDGGVDQPTAALIALGAIARSVVVR